MYFLYHSKDIFITQIKEKSQISTIFCALAIAWHSLNYAVYMIINTINRSQQWNEHSTFAIEKVLDEIASNLVKTKSIYNNKYIHSNFFFCVSKYIITQRPQLGREARQKKKKNLKKGEKKNFHKNTLEPWLKFRS